MYRPAASESVRDERKRFGRTILATHGSEEALLLLSVLSTDIENAENLYAERREGQYGRKYRKTIEKWGNHVGLERETVHYAPGADRREATDLDHTVCVSWSVSGVRKSQKP